MQPLATRLLVVMLLAIASGCAQHSVRPSAEFEQHRAQLAALPNWQLRAKMGLKVAGKSHTAMVNWQQTGPAFAINLNGPMGIGAVTLTGDNGQVTLRQSGQRDRSAGNAEQLLKNATGISAPLDDLRFWLRGLPAPGAVSELNPDPAKGTLQSFQQHGWTVELNKYQRINGVWLPGRLSVTGKADQNQQQRKLLVLISHWRFAEQ